MLWTIAILACSWHNNPGAMSTFMFWMLLTLPFFMLLPVLYNVSLVAVNDGCAAMEDLVVSRVENGSTPAKLLDFYLFQRGSPNIRALLNSTGVVDLNQVEGQINSTRTQVVNEVRRAAPAVRLPSCPSRGTCAAPTPTTPPPAAARRHRPQNRTHRHRPHHRPHRHRPHRHRPHHHLARAGDQQVQAQVQAAGRAGRAAGRRGQRVGPRQRAARPGGLRPRQRAVPRLQGLPLLHAARDGGAPVDRHLLRGCARPALSGARPPRRLPWAFGPRLPVGPGLPAPRRAAPSRAPAPAPAGAGLFGWLLLFCAFVQLGQLDKLPKDGCCGCQRFSAGDYKAMPTDDFEGGYAEVSLPGGGKGGKGKPGAPPAGLGLNGLPQIVVRAEAAGGSPGNSPFAMSQGGSPFAEQPLLGGMQPSSRAGSMTLAQAQAMGLLAPSGNSYSAAQRGYDAVAYGALPPRSPSGSVAGMPFPQHPNQPPPSV